MTSPPAQHDHSEFGSFIAMAVVTLSAIGFLMTQLL